SASMVRNLYRTKGRPRRSPESRSPGRDRLPRRSCRKRTGPGESARMRHAITDINGAASNNTPVGTTTSIARMATRYPQAPAPVTAVRRGAPGRDRRRAGFAQTLGVAGCVVGLSGLLTSGLILEQRAAPADGVYRILVGALREQRTGRSIVVVVPDGVERRVDEVPEILLPVIDGTAWGDAPVGIDRHRPVQVEASLVEKVSPVPDLLRMVHVIRGILGEPLGGQLHVGELVERKAR